MKLITPATVEPITVSELARNLRLYTGEGDYAGSEQDLLRALISAAREDAEHYTGRIFARCKLQQTFRDFSTMLILHHDLISVVSVSYYDVSNQLQTIDPENYFTTQDNLLFTADSFPPVFPRGDAVIVDFEAGQTVIKPTVQQAILLIASHWYENREASSPLQVRDVPLSYQWLLDSHRDYKIA